MMRYPHWIRITTPGEGEPVEDPEAGTYTPPDPEVIYDGPADVQDVGAEVIYGVDQTTKRSGATAFVEDESIIPLVRSGMSVVITWNPGEDPLQTEDAVVETVTRLDGTIGLKRV